MHSQKLAAAITVSCVSFPCNSAILILCGVLWLRDVLYIARAHRSLLILLKLTVVWKINSRGKREREREREQWFCSRNSYYLRTVQTGRHGGWRICSYIACCVLQHLARMHGRGLTTSRISGNSFNVVRSCRVYVHSILVYACNCHGSRYVALSQLRYLYLHYCCWRARRKVLRILE